MRKYISASPMAVSEVRAKHLQIYCDTISPWYISYLSTFFTVQFQVNIVLFYFNKTLVKT